MTKRLKVLTLVGTRPEIIRLSRVIPALDRLCDHCLVHTGQNYDFELNEVFFQDLGLRKPDHFLNSVGPSACATIGRIIEAVDAVLLAERPDAVLVLGDTNSCLGVISAKRRHIPIFHMEAGNRCFDDRVPEETNRRIVDHTADVNLTYSDIARQYLLREGLPPDRIIKTGSPMREVLTFNARSIARSDIVNRLSLHPKEYFVVSLHREENVDDPSAFLRAVEVLNAVAKDYGQPVIVSTHPRTRKHIDARGARFDERIQLLAPLGYHDYVRLQMDARVVLSDSGTITEESSILGFRALNLREAHERPEGMETAAVMMVGLNVERVRQALEVLLEDSLGAYAGSRMPDDYEPLNVSENVVRIIISYVDYVRRTVWRES